MTYGYTSVGNFMPQAFTPGLSSFGFPPMGGVMPGMMPGAFGTFGGDPTMSYAASMGTNDAIDFAYSGMGSGGSLFNPAFGGCYGGFGYNSKIQQQLANMSPQELQRYSIDMQKLNLQGNTEISEAYLQNQLNTNIMYNKIQARAEAPELGVTQKSAAINTLLKNNQDISALYDNAVRETMQLYGLSRPAAENKFRTEYSQKIGSSLDADISTYAHDSFGASFWNNLFGGIFSNGGRSREEYLAMLNHTPVPQAAVVQQQGGQTLGTYGPWAAAGLIGLSVLASIFSRGKVKIPKDLRVA